MVQYPNDEMPPLQKISSEFMHAQKIQGFQKQKQGPVTYKCVGRKKSSSGVDKNQKARERVAQFTDHNIMENSILEPSIIKHSMKDRNNINAQAQKILSVSHGNTNITKSHGTSHGGNGLYYNQMQDAMNSQPTKVNRQKLSAERTSVAISNTSKGKCRSKIGMSSQTQRDGHTSHQYYFKKSS